MKKKLPFKSYIRLYLSGFLMGTADVVPGVSGGTIAFLLGIYEELIESIRIISSKVLRLVFKFRIKEAFNAVPFGFLLPLFIGILSAIATLAGGISFLLRTQPSFLWSFFFGLVLASAYVVKKRVVTWNRHDYLALAIFTIIGYFLAGIVPVETPKTLLAFFLSGAIAICATILPGVSGSFLLVVMGKYEQILTAVVNKDFLVIFVFMSGAVCGIILFSRLLSWLFAKHHDIVVASLIGFMFGSLRKIWPWKEVVETRINSHGNVVPIVDINVLPNISYITIFELGLITVGFLVIIFLDRFKFVEERVEDIQSPKFEKTHEKAVKSQKSGQL